MNDFLRYVLESGFCLAIFYAAYWLLLKKETYFFLNRVYLVSSLLVSFLIPALSISSPFRTVMVTHQTFLSAQNGMLRLSRPVGPAEILLAVYAAGILFFFSRFVFHLAGLRKVIRRAGVRNYHRLKIVSVDGEFSPFSFLNFVFINEKSSTESGLQRILAHEQVHIRQFHSLDVLLMELVIIIQWFNPFVWPYKKSLKETHEYLADDGVIAQGFSAALYKLLVVEQHVGAPLFEFANNFKQSQIKRRITMMSKIKSKNAAKLKLLLVVPLASFLVLAFAEPRPVSTLDSASLSAPQENAGQSQGEFEKQQKFAQAKQELRKLKEMEMKIDQKLKTSLSPEQEKELRAKLEQVLKKRQEIETFIAEGGGSVELNPERLKAEYKGLEEEEAKVRKEIEKADDPEKKSELKGRLEKILEKQAQIEAMSEAARTKEHTIEELKKESEMLKVKEADVRAMLEKTQDTQKKAELEDTLKKIAQKQEFIKQKALALKAAEAEKK
jgi:hypothetical protein